MAKPTHKPTKRRAPELSAQEELFVELYFRLKFDPVAAYIAAGYAPKTAKTNGPQKLRSPRIIQAVRRKSAVYAQRTAMSREEALAHCERWIRDDASGRGNQIQALRTWATMTGNDGPGAGDARKLSLEDMRDAARDDLMRMINGGYSAHALPAANIIDVEAEPVEGQE